MAGKITYEQLKRGYECAVEQMGKPSLFVMNISELRRRLGDEEVERLIRTGEINSLTVVDIIDKTNNSTDSYEESKWQS